MGEYLSTDEIAEKLGIPKRSVQRLIREGKLNAIKVGRDYRVHVEEVERYIVDIEKGSGKTYSPLTHYLKSLTTDSITLSLEEIEAILSARLPVSATKYRAWYGNDISHVQSQSWMNAGWKVDNVDLGKTVTFVRV